MHETLKNITVAVGTIALLGDQPGRQAVGGSTGAVTDPAAAASLLNTVLTKSETETAAIGTSAFSSTCETLWKPIQLPIILEQVLKSEIASPTFAITSETVSSFSRRLPYEEKAIEGPRSRSFELWLAFERNRDLIRHGTALGQLAV